jgi:hypothetical protein
MNTHSLLSKAICAGLFAGLVGAAPLKADEWLKFGAGLHIASPSGDLVNEKDLLTKVKMGFGLSAFGELGINAKMALRGRVDYNVFGEGEKKESYLDTAYGYLINVTQTVKRTASVTSVFADYIYRFNSHENGFYAFAGLGLVNGKNDWEIKTSGSAETITVEGDVLNVPGSGSNLGVSLGVGYSLSNHIAFELLWVSASDVIEIKGEDKKYGCDWMQVSFKYRF